MRPTRRLPHTLPAQAFAHTRALISSPPPSVISGGESLGELAAEHSICPSKNKAGDIGWIGRGRTVPEFEAAAFAAAPGQVVTVRSQFGWHLLQVTDQR